MKAYWVPDSLKFIEAKDMTYGHNQTYEGYQKDTLIKQQWKIIGGHFTLV